MTKTETEVTAHPLDEALVAFKDSFDAVVADEQVPSEQRLAALQEPFNDLAATIRSALQGEPTQSATQTNEDIGQQIVKAVQEAVAPLNAEVAAMKAQLEARSDVKPSPPVRRSIQASDLQATQVVQRNAPKKFTPLRDVVRRSVGIQN